MPFEIVRNDITRMEVDAIVNAANEGLLGGGGVDGAIHRAAGPRLLEACRAIGGCPTGDVRITPGFDLPCRWVIHTVGPVWRGGGAGEAELLRACYARSLALALATGCRSVAFPLISAGAYGYPREEALRIATGAIRDFLMTEEMQVYLVVYDRASFSIGEKLYERIRSYIDDSAVPEESLAEAMRRRRYNAMDAAPAPFAAPAAPAPAAPKRRRRESAAASEAFESIKPAVIHPETRPDDNLEDYLRQIDEGFRDMLLRLIDERGMTDAECYKLANVDRKLFNKIKNVPDYRPGKSTVLAFAVALKLPLPQIREMLGKAGFSLSRSSKADLIVEFFVRQGCYDVFEINEALFSFDQKLLGSAL